jgi:hypothetical protein
MRERSLPRSRPGNQSDRVLAGGSETVKFGERDRERGQSHGVIGLSLRRVRDRAARGPRVGECSRAGDGHRTPTIVPHVRNRVVNAASLDGLFRAVALAGRVACSKRAATSVTPSCARAP